MKIREEEERDTAGVNLTPMIDVVFLLIIFFMVSTTFIELEKDLEIDLPRSEAGTSAADPLEVILVNVQKDGTIVMDGKEVSVEALTYRLQRAAEADPEQGVEIRGDRAADLDSVVRVLDACQKAEIRNTALRAREMR